MTESKSYLRPDQDSFIKEDRSFGVRDRLGRIIGARAVRFFVKALEPTSDNFGRGYRSTFEPNATYYGFVPHSTRNGATYGAAQSYQFFKTHEERETAIDKYFAGAAKRATKREGK